MLKVILASIVIAALGFIPLMGIPGVFVFMLSKPFVYLMYGPLAFEAWSDSLGASSWALFIILALLWPITIPIAYWISQKLFGPVPFFRIKHLLPFCILVVLGSTLISTVVVAMNPTIKRLSDTELLENAIRHDHLFMIKKHWYVKENSSYSFGDPLFLALNNKSVKVANYFLDNGADPKKYSQKAIYNEPGVAPLHTATRLGLTMMMEKLLQMGVDPNIRSTSGRTPLHDLGGLDKGNGEEIEILRKYNADFTAVDKNGNTALMTMVLTNAPLDKRPLYAEKLIEYGCPKNAKNNAGQSALDLVAEYELDLIKVLQ